MAKFSKSHLFAWVPSGRAAFRALSGLIALSYAVASFLMPLTASAYFTGCAASVSPTSVNIGTSDTFTISITSGSSSALQWVDISVPSSHYTYAGNSISGWSTADHGNGTTATGGSIAQNQTQDFPILVYTDIQDTSPESWSVNVSTDPSGANAFACSGSLATSMTGSMPQNSPNGVSNISVTNINQTSAVINWQSDAATSSLVYYGTTSSYGSQSTYDTADVTSHSVQLTGLTNNTTYHFQVAGTDGQGTYDYSIDNTFVTVTPSSGGGGTSGGGSSGGGGGTQSSGGSSATGSSGGSTTPSITSHPSTTVADTVPPQVMLDTKPSGTYKNPPTFTGSASDDHGVAAVEYTTDNGKDWLPVNSLVTAGGQKVTFSFTPTLPNDGNYTVAVRAIDVAGNMTTSPSQVLVIDRLPPVVGGNLASIGPEVVQPDNQGMMHALLGTDLQLTLSAVGGPTSVVVDALLNNSPKVEQSFSLTQSADTGLWSGVLNFQHAGTYQLIVRGLDGAGNKTQRPLGQVVVDQPASIVDAATNKPLDATVKVFYRDPETNTWVLWDGSSYEQTNPYVTSKSGRYGFYLPGGTYYFQINAHGYTSEDTKSFSIDGPTIVTAGVKLHHRPSFNLGPIHWQLPWFDLHQIDVLLGEKASTAANAPAINHLLPTVTLAETDGSKFDTTKLYGKPTVLTFVSTWSAPARDQLSILAQINNPAINVIPVGSGESSSRLASYAGIAGYTLPLVIDDANQLTSQLGLSALPTSYFIDRHGVVKKVVVGVLSKEELLTYASSGL